MNLLASPSNYVEHLHIFPCEHLLRMLRQRLSWQPVCRVRAPALHLMLLAQQMLLLLLLRPVETRLSNREALRS